MAPDSLLGTPAINAPFLHHNPVSTDWLSSAWFDPVTLPHPFSALVSPELCFLFHPLHSWINGPQQPGSLKFSRAVPMLSRLWAILGGLPAAVASFQVPAARVNQVLCTQQGADAR